jgi:hypothetical protein
MTTNKLSQGPVVLRQFGVLHTNGEARVIVVGLQEMQSSSHGAIVLGMRRRRPGWRSMHRRSASVGLLFESLFRFEEGWWLWPLDLGCHNEEWVALFWIEVGEGDGLGLQDSFHSGSEVTTMSQATRANKVKIVVGPQRV